MRSSALFLSAGLLAAATVLTAAPTSTPFYEQHNLVSSDSDADLVNAWGLTSSARSPWWVADNGTNLSTLYNSAGAKQGLKVQVPGAPSGAVFNSTTGFALNAGNNSGGKTGNAAFLFATESGTLLAWNNTGVPTQAVVVVPAPGGQATGAIYKGLAIAKIADTQVPDISALLYATNFHGGTVDTFDQNFNPVTTPGGFADPTIPEGYAPFGIQVIGSTVFVSYAQQDDDAEDDVAGHGHGFVNAFDLTGHWMMRVASAGNLNSPWGLAMAPAGWGAFGGKLLVGNFGDGLINAFDPSLQNSDGTLLYLGFLHSAGGPPLKIDGLWALQFAQGGANGTPDQLFFTAGPDHEDAGLFGFLTPAGPPGQTRH
jgi:uncharacterized protein (TIGR03118 family)